MIISLTAVSLSVFVLINTIFKNKYINKNESVLSYDHGVLVNYSVNLVPNNIYEKNVLGEGNVYLTDFVDRINTSLFYNFKGDKVVDIKGECEVIAVVEGFLSNDKNSKSLWSRRFTLQPKTDFSFSGEGGEFRGELPINIKSYNALLQQADKTFSMNFIGKLTVIWNINIEGSSSEGKFRENLAPKMELPLNEKYFQITSNLSKQKEGNLEKEVRVINPKFYYFIIMSSCGILSGLLLALYLLFFTLPKKGEKPSAEKAYKILKSCGDKLVALRDDSVDGSEVIIRVMSMEDLIKVSEYLDKPIFYKHSSDIKNITYFYIVEGRKIYAYYII